MTSTFGNSFVNDLRQGIHQLMATDERVFLVGEDLTDPYGGAFGVTRGISTKFPERVLATPISEAGFTGVAIGMAIRGLRPIVELMFGDFITLTMDQIVNVASKMSGMYSDGVPVPVVIRASMGGGRGYGPTHSQTLDKLILGIPGLTLVAPSVFHSPGDLLRIAVTTTRSPVVFTENKMLYPVNLMTDGGDGLTLEYREGLLGYKSAVVRNHPADENPDITLITYGGMSIPVAQSMQQLVEEEVRITAVIPSVIDPLPIDDLVESANVSPAILVIEEGVESFGWGAEIAASLAERIEARPVIARLGAAERVIPAARQLEDLILPTSKSITAKILDVFECTA
jgi:pyruvate/2-oxoglutarate/acetoin dehydrogenase E1 component